MKQISFFDLTENAKIADFKKFFDSRYYDYVYINYMFNKDNGLALLKTFEQFEILENKKLTMDIKEKIVRMIHKRIYSAYQEMSPTLEELMNILNKQL